MPAPLGRAQVSRKVLAINRLIGGLSGQLFGATRHFPPAGLETALQHAPNFEPPRLAHRPYCTDDKASGLQIRSQSTALARRYIQANAPELQFRVVLDIDHDVRATAHERYWHDEYGVPEPSWTAITPGTGRAHVAYELAIPIAKHDNARSGPIRYGAAIEGGLAIKLRADSGYAGLVCKNPLHPDWDTVPGRLEPYELAELAEWVDLIPKAKLRESVHGALGRNCLLFEHLRHWAYRAVVPFKSSGGRRDNWEGSVLKQALELNNFSEADVMQRDPLAYSEIKATARSVARYTWQNFSEASKKALVDRTHTPELQAARGRRSGEARRASTESHRATARLLKIQGKSMRAIAEELSVSQSTISRWLSA